MTPDYKNGWLSGMDFARTARFPQFEDRENPYPDGQATRAWLDGFAEGILISREEPEIATEVREFCVHLLRK